MEYYALPRRIIAASIVLAVCLFHAGATYSQTDTTYILIEAKSHELFLPYPTQSIPTADSVLLRGPSCTLPTGFETACGTFGAQYIQRAFDLSGPSDTLLATNLGDYINTAFLHDYYTVPMTDTAAARQLVEYLCDSLGIHARLPARVVYDGCLNPDELSVDPGQIEWRWYSQQAPYQGIWNPACEWDYMMHMPCAWWKHEGSSWVRIGFLDTGVNREVPDLDDTDWIGDTEFVYPHGTMVASIAVADWDDGDMAGLNRYCGAGAYKQDILCNEIVSTNQLIRAARDCQIINCSWHFGDIHGNLYTSLLFHRAVAELSKAGRVVFAAGGNRGADGEDNDPQCPANLPEVIAIAGYKPDGNRIDNGTYQYYIDFAMPGYQILGVASDSVYYKATETSFATPAASAVASMIISYADEQGYDVQDRDDIYGIMKASVDELAIAGWNVNTGWGAPRLDRAYIQLELPNTIERYDITGPWEETVQACEVTFNGVLDSASSTTRSANRHLLTKWVHYPEYIEMHNAWIRGSSSVSARNGSLVTDAYAGEVLEFTNDSCLVRATYYTIWPHMVNWPDPEDIGLKLTLLGERKLAPPDLSADLTDPTKVILNWNDPNTNEQGQKIYRKEGDGNWYAETRPLGYTSRQYTDTVASTYYRYYLRVYTDNQDVYTDTVVVKHPPRTPENIQATVLWGEPGTVPLDKPLDILSEEPGDQPTNRVRVTWNPPENQPAGTLEKYVIRIEYGTHEDCWPCPPPQDWCCVEQPSYVYLDGPSSCLDTLCLELNHAYKITVLAVDIYGDSNVIRDEIQFATGLVDHCAETVIPVCDKTTIPDTYELSQNWPNPFNASTVIDFGLPQPGDVRLVVYDVLGRRVRHLLDDYLLAGYHSFTWNGLDDHGSPVASGMYFYRLIAGEYMESRKMMLVK